MIPKIIEKSKDPADYRPISLTSCLGKFAERMFKTRLYNYLEVNNLFRGTKQDETLVYCIPFCSIK